MEFEQNRASRVALFWPKKDQNRGFGVIFEAVLATREALFCSNFIENGQKIILNFENVFRRVRTSLKKCVQPTKLHKLNLRKKVLLTPSETTKARFLGGDQKNSPGTT